MDIPTDRVDGPLDPIAEAILESLAVLKPGRALSPEAIARTIAAARARPQDPPDRWRRYLNPVKQQAVHLARAGRIEIVRKGKPVDPNDFKGVIRLRLTQAPAGDPEADA